ncbi:crotonobetainyl-CoA:carnitine CoA-transferase CaiB-like acyl-CoA transferase [Arthrobacter sp. AG258]|uniref:CoA transferase n=1 Tax=Arthrobacter sp. AG258 TaxID=2183899 RepID=UPI001061843F|nr:CoA transferase [Arthrobacter sp. AG258]TDT79516.1 crotonobetainyl-CoA:carnitine CoA-transferase CaiB-like acyl-CoA transferase [Arthrobacter sp. AG258]
MDVNFSSHTSPRILPFENLKVADFSETIAGQFAARLLADHGADVTLVRQNGPRPESGARQSGTVDGHPAEHALMDHLNAPKIQATWTTGEPCPSVAADADIMIFSNGQAAADALKRYPECIIAVVTDFADEGPYRNWSATEIVHQALSGSMYYNGRSGEPPLFGAGDRASYAAGLCLYIRIVATIRARMVGISDPGLQQIAVHEAAAAMEQNFSTQWSYSKSIAQRGELTRPKGRVKCKDGWVVFFAMPSRLAELFTAFGADDLLEDPRFSSWNSFIQNLSSARDAFEERASSISQEQLLTAALKHKLVLSPVRSLGDLFQDQQLAERDFWTNSPVSARSDVLLGPMWRPFYYRPGAKAGKTHTEEHDASASFWDFLKDAARSDADPAHLEQNSRPLDGLRIADFTTAWSGPLATRILASLGATVIKVESRTHMDAWRGPQVHATHPESYPGGEPGLSPYNRNAWFNTQNVDKQSVALDLKNPTERDSALTLAASCDIVLGNFSPGTMARLGLGFDQLRTANPDIVMTEMSGYGDTGFLREHRAYGQTMEAMAGITSLIGYEDGEPLGSGSAYLDPMGGLAGAAAALTALIARDRTGAAQYTEVPQREAAMHWIGELILDSRITGHVSGPSGNAVKSAFPQDAFACAGDDEWLALSVETAEQWQALCSSFGWHDLLADNELLTVEGRRRHSEIIMHRLRTRSELENKSELAHALQTAGVPAAPVQNGKDLYFDPQLRHRGWFTALTHPEAGTHDYPGLPFSGQGSLYKPKSPAPTLGQHTEQALEQPGTESVRSQKSAGVNEDRSVAEQYQLRA